MAEGEQTVVSNRRARHEFEVLERFEAGLVLQGTEVKSLRDGKVVLRDAYASERDGELWLINATIEPYAQGNRENHEPKRDRKLLVKRLELDRLAARVAEKGLTLVPLRLYFKDGKREGRDRARSRPRGPRQARCDRRSRRPARDRPRDEDALPLLISCGCSRTGATRLRHGRSRRGKEASRGFRLAS